MTMNDSRKKYQARKEIIGPAMANMVSHVPLEGLLLAYSYTKQP